MSDFSRCVSIITLWASTRARSKNCKVFSGDDSRTSQTIMLFSKSVRALFHKKEKKTRKISWGCSLPIFPTITNIFESQEIFLTDILQYTTCIMNTFLKFQTTWLKYCKYVLWTKQKSKPSLTFPLTFYRFWSTYFTDMEKWSLWSSWRNTSTKSFRWCSIENASKASKWIKLKNCNHMLECSEKDLPVTSACL